MRYEDASHTGAFAQASEPDARNDADAIAAGAHGPATGNVITGEGTQTGPSGSDYATGAHITSIAGAGGEDSSFAGGKLAVSGEFGRLSIDAEGNYNYVAKAGTPENSRDRFTYTLADNQGNSDTATLTVEIGKTPAVIKANAQQVVPGPDGVVILPPGVELSDIHIVGRNLVIDLPDGSQMVIIDGAVFVPQLVLGGVEVPATNLAALLVGQEIAPAAGEGPPQSSGGNFDVPVPPLDPGVPLGDLIPPTEYTYIPPEVREVFDLIDEEPEIFIQPDGQPAAVNAIDSVDEKGLPERNEGEPEGSGEEAAAGADGDTSEATGGTIVIDSPDGVDSLTITGDDGIPHEIVVGLVVDGAYGTLTITGIVGSNYTYSYVLDDNIDHSDGVPDHDDFSVTLTDNDGDQATATLQIDIIDDVPTARPDTDFIAAGDYGPVTGNVITDDDAGDHDISGTDSDTDNGADTVGADDASLTAITGFGATTPTEGGFTVVGQYGVLTIDSDGSYSYTRNQGTPGGVTDVFNYTLTDGDDDTSSTTLTITIEDAHIDVGENPDVLTDDDAVPLAEGNPGGPGDNVDADHLTGTLSGSGGDGPLTFDLQTTGAPSGFTYVDGPDGSVLVKQVQDGVNVTVLTITLNAATGAYEVAQNAPILHDPANPGAGEGQEDNFENNTSFTINYTVSDQDDDVESGTLTINVDDDTPEVTENQIGGTVDEDGLDGGNLGGVNDVLGADVTVLGDVSELFSPGADQPLSFSLLEDTSGLRQDLTSKGVAVTYDVDGNTLTASAGDRPVFTFVLNPESGEYTFTLLDQLDHPSLDGETGDDTENPTDQDLAIALGTIIQATDADGDSVTAPGNGLIITVDDDSPLPFDGCPEEVISVNDPNAEPFTGSLNLPPVGADEPGVVTFGVSDGDAVLDTEGNPVTSGEDPLFYFINGDGVLEARVGDATGELIFTITLNGDGTFTYDQVGQIGIGGTVSFDNFDEADAGNTNYLGLGNDDAGSAVDLLMSAGENTDADADIEDTTVNTDSDSIGAQNQSMDANDSEVLRLDFVSNLQTGGAGPTGFSFSGHVATNSYLQLVPQVQGNQDEVAAFKVWALDSTLTDAAAPDRNPTDGFSDASPVTITEVTIIDFETGDTHIEDISGLANGATEALDFGVSVTRNADGSVTFSGIQEGDQYGVATGSNSFNAIAVQATDHSFDLGVFSIGVANEFEPVDLQVPIILTDSDGDSVACDIDIHIGEPLVVADATVTVNEAGLPIIGSDSASNSEIDSGTLVPSGGTGPFTFTLLSDANGQFGNLVLNPNTGAYTYTLDTPFDSQPDANDGTNPELGAESFDVLITDSEGATHTATITVNIIDDIPSIDVTANDSAGNKVLTQDADTIGVGVQDSATSTVAFNGAFAIASAVPGADGVSAINPGPDGNYALSLAPGYVEGTVTTMLSHGVAIRIYISASGVITGSTAADEGSISDANRIFTISVSNAAGDEGEVTLTQYQQLDHPIASDPTATEAPFVDHELLLPDNLVRLTFSATLQDGDGDIDSDSAFIDLGGNVGFQDHGPVANNDSDALAPGNVGIADGNVLTGVGGTDTFGADGVADNVGADTPGRISAITFGATTLAIVDGGSQVINGDFGQLTIFSNGNYSYDRFDDSAGGGSDVFTYTLIDFDGDTDQATLTINIGINPPVASAATAKVDDDGLAGANPAGTNDINANDGTETGAGIGNEKIYTGSLAASVTGGDGDVDFRLVEPADGASIGQETVNYSLTDIAGVQTLTATIATSPLGGRVGTELFTVVLNKETGAYTVDLKDNVLHGDDANNDEDGTEVTASVQFIATDAGLTDSNAATLTIQFNDDVPTANDDGPVIQATENVAFTIDALANDVFGADGVDINSATKVVITANATQGVVTYDTTTHLFTYTPNADAGSSGTSDSFTYKIIDADGDEDSATVNITLQPDSTPQVVNVVAAIDDDGLVGSPNGVLEAGNGDIDANTVTNPDDTAGAFSAESSFSGQLTVNFGGDTGTVDFSNLDSTFGQVGTERVQYHWNAGTHILTATVTPFLADGTTAQARANTDLFQVNLSSSGAYTVTLLDNVLHASGGNNENSAPVVDLNYRAIETGGFDAVTTGKLSITFNDDMPRVTDVTDPLDIENTGATPTGTGDFAFTVGADNNLDGDDLSVSDFRVTVNNAAASNIVLTPGVETGGSANYSFSFDYSTGTGTATAEGTLVFDKTSGEYTVTLTNGPIAGISLVETSDAGTQITEVNANVSVAEFSNGLFAQLTGMAGSPFNTVDYNPDPPASDGVGTTFIPGEVLSAATTTVQVSSIDAGVAGNTLQGSEIMDLNLYSSDPGAATGGAPTAHAEGLFITLDGIGAAEDMIVVLKLWSDTNGNGIIEAADSFTTRAVMVTNADLFKFKNAGDVAATYAATDGTIGEGVANDIINTGSGNEGLIIIESNDYNAAGETWQIVGAQIAGGNSGVSGAAINLNKAVNKDGPPSVSGDSDVNNDGILDPDNFTTDAGDGPFKIKSIGFQTEGTQDQSATIEFDVTVTDDDGDSVTTQDVTVNIGDPSALPLLAAESSSSSESSFSKMLLSSNDNSKWNGGNYNGFGNVGNTGVVASMVAASGLMAMPTDFHSLGDISTNLVAQNSFQQASMQLAGHGDGGAITGLTFSNELSAPAFDAMPMASSGHNFNSLGNLSHMLDTVSSHAIAAPMASLAADQGPAIHVAAAMPVAPAVAMISADMMKAVGLIENVQHGGTVEKVLAEALGGHGAAPTVDGLLQAIIGHGDGGLAAISQVTSPAAAGVPTWDMAAHGAIVPGADMMFKMGAEMLHHDAVQPVVNG